MGDYIRFSAGDEIPGLYISDPRRVAEAALRARVREGDWIHRLQLSGVHADVRYWIHEILREEIAATPSGSSSERRGPIREERSRLRIGGEHPSGDPGNDGASARIRRVRERLLAEGRQ